jgi:hypothetical protein
MTTGSGSICGCRTIATADQVSHTSPGCSARCLWACLRIARLLWLTFTAVKDAPAHVLPAPEPPIRPEPEDEGVRRRTRTTLIVSLGNVKASLILRALAESRGADHVRYQCDRSRQDDRAVRVPPEMGRGYDGARMQVRRTGFATEKEALTTYRRLCRQLYPHVGGVRASRLSARIVERAYRDLEPAGYSRTTLRTLNLVLVKAFDEQAGRSPGVRKPRESDDAQQVWTLAEARRCADHVREDRLYPMWRPLLVTSLRRGRGELTRPPWHSPRRCGSRHAARSRTTATGRSMQRCCRQGSSSGVSVRWCGRPSPS